MPETLLLRDCSARLAGHEVLSSISLDLPGPGLHCLIGANGAGKTTLLRLVCGLLEHGSGSVRLGKRDLLAMSGRERAGLVSYVPQIADSSVPLSVSESLEVARGANPAAGRSVDEVLGTMNLQRFAERQLSQLSGGELKRAMIAQALAQDTQVMLLDEPTAHLDPPARLEVMQLLRRIAHEDGRLLLTSLHYPDLAREFADSVVLLRDGRITGNGEPAEMTSEGRLAGLYAADPETLEVSA